jgi:hypothetical protein
LGGGQKHAFQEDSAFANVDESQLETHDLQADIGRGGREVFLFEKEPVAKDNSSVE